MHRIVALVSLLLLLASCSDTNSTGGPDATADVGVDAFVAGDCCVAEPDVLPEIMAPETIVPDVEEDTTPSLTLPVEPARPDPAVALVDRTYVQEFNHTYNEQPAELGAVVALVMPPAGFADFARPTLVDPRGLWRPDGEDALSLLALPEDAADIVDAAATDVGLWLLTGTALFSVDAAGDVTLHAALPDGATGRGLEMDAGGLWVLADTNVGRLADEGIDWLDRAEPPMAILDVDQVRVIATSEALVVEALDDGTEIGSQPLSVGEPVALLTNRTLPQTLDLVVVGSEGLAGFAIGDSGFVPVDVPLFAADRVPLTGAVRAVPDSNGGFLVAASGGAYRVDEGDYGLEYRVYVPDRWMPPGRVNDVLEDTSVENGPMFFATAGGLGRMTRQPYTLAEKIETMIERIVLRHDRDGALADSRLEVPGDLSTNLTWHSDNDGGWTCYWVLSECFRYQLTGAEDAKANFDKSLERMLSFRTLTGTEHFLARSVIRIDGCHMGDECDGPGDGEWFLSPDGEWWVKRDTSNDEVTSHMFMMGHAYDLCADEEQRAAIVAHVDGIIGGIVENGYQLIDPITNECTSYGQFDPFYVNQWFAGALGDGGRRSAQMLGAINLAYYLTGDEKYLAAKQELIEEHHYDENVTNIGDEELYGFCAGSGDCDELGFQAFVPLLRYESDPALREMWMAGWRQHYEHLASQEDAFWDIADAVFEGGDYDPANSRRWYERYPMDLVRWNIRNDGVRQDAIAPPPYYEVQEAKPNYKLRSDGHCFPADERPNHRHNGPQFQFDGGWGNLRELDGGDALFPYWYGRYYGFVADPDEEE